MAPGIRMRESWRWFGPGDPVSLAQIRQTGATDIVCALYDIPAGDVWTLDAIRSLKQEIETAPPGDTPLRWRVVESIPVHEDIKLGRDTRDRYIDNWILSLSNLASCGIEVICYNFMPVIDWTRTDLRHRLPSGAYTLRFDQQQYAVFDLHILARPNAAGDYSDEELALAESRFAAMTDDDKIRLTETIVAGLPGRMTDSYDLDRFRDALAAYDGVDRAALQANLDYFLQRVVPEAERVGVRLAIHPDDPPWSLFGLPRVVCNAEDVGRVFSRTPGKSNGLALCAGTFGSDVNNDVPAMAKTFRDRIYFTHLRSVAHDPSEPRSFVEAAHLEGDVNLIEVVRTLLRHEKQARLDGDGDRQIYFRPDHGHQMLDDVDKAVNPGYSMIGRLKGLAELRGVIRALESGDT